MVSSVQGQGQDGPLDTKGHVKLWLGSSAEEGVNGNLSVNERGAEDEERPQARSAAEVLFPARLLRPFLTLLAPASSSRAL